MSFLPSSFLVGGAADFIDLVAPGGALSPLEQRVIALAQHDDLGSVRPEGRIERLIGSLFGGRRPNRLADPHLESLRCFAVRYWHERRMAPNL